jgi:hypothetical protein
MAVLSSFFQMFIVLGMYNFIAVLNWPFKNRLACLANIGFCDMTLSEYLLFAFQAVWVLKGKSLGKKSNVFK